MKKSIKGALRTLKRLVALPQRLYRLFVRIESGVMSADALFQLEILKQMWPEAVKEILPKVTITSDALPDIASWYIRQRSVAALREHVNKNLVAMAQGLVSLPNSMKIALFEDALRIPSEDSTLVFSQYIAFLSQYDCGDVFILDAGHRFISLGPTIWRREYQEAWGLYLSALVRNRKIDEAKEVLQCYYKHYRLTGLDAIPYASLFSRNNGYSNSDIDKSALLMELFLSAEKEHLLERFLSGKRIAIVGNSPLELGQGRGAEIDDYDVVIRFNMATIDSKYQADYGGKTTIMSRNVMPMPFRPPSNVEMVILPDGVERIPLHSELVREILGFARKGVKICGIPLQDYRDIMTDAGFPHISTGIAICAYIKKLVPTLSRKNLYGFSHLLDDCTVNYGDFEQFHYYGHRCDDIADTTFHVHPLAKEREYLLRIFPE